MASSPVLTLTDSNNTVLSTLNFGVVDAGNYTGGVRVRVYNNLANAAGISDALNPTITTKTYNGLDSGDSVANGSSGSVVPLLFWNNKGGSSAVSDAVQVSITTVTFNGLTTGDTVANGQEIVTDTMFTVECTSQGDTVYTPVGGATTAPIANTTGNPGTIQGNAGGTFAYVNTQIVATSNVTADFNASMKIVQVVVQKTTGAYSSQFDTPATMQIIGVGNLTIPASVVFKGPPFDIDTPASVSFTQFSHNNYPATITIKNINLGGGCANVTLQSSGSDTINVTPVPNPTPPPFSNQIVNVPSDATGFFQINNLTPGDGCFIDQTQGQPGTYSIEGFIVIADNTLSNIFTVIIDPNIAQGFRGTLEL
ncbi:unnamed protein product [Sphagnum compactum]